MLRLTREMAKELYQAEAPLKLYEFHKKFGSDPLKIVIAAKFFEKIGAAKFDERKLYPSEDTRQIIFSHRGKFFGHSQSERRKKRDLRIRAFEPYLPDLSLIDVDFFRNRIANKDGEA